MRKLYMWKAIHGDELIDPPSIGPYYDDIDLNELYESEELALSEAAKYEKAGGFVDLVLLTVYELDGA